MSIDAIAEIEGTLAGRVGLRLDPALRTRLLRGVREESEEAGLGLDEYSLVLETNPAVLQRLLNRITVQQTWFFRDSVAFAALASEVIPKLDEPILAWSAGCSNGQEAYSLAMLLAESRRKDWRVVGTDVSTEAIGRADGGLYTEDEIKSLSSERVARYLRPSAGKWVVTPELRKRVRFEHHNLTSDTIPISAGSCSVVMCRNVLIYFNHDELRRVLDRVATAMRPDGYLFLGGAESLWRLSDRFQLTRVAGAFAYRLPPATPFQERRRKSATVRKETRRPANLVGLRASAEAAAAAGLFAVAASSLRQATHIDPDQPVLHFQLALCLESAGQPEGARMALEACRAAIARCETSRIEAALEGFRLDQLLLEIERRLRRLE